MSLLCFIIPPEAMWYSLGFVSQEHLFAEHPHRRLNPLTGEWILVSPHRTRRPWVGQKEKEEALPPAYDPTCYLCPGNERAAAVINPNYTNTFVFENDFAALLPDTPEGSSSRGVFRAELEPGTCRVICFSPRHDLSLALMSPQEVRSVVDVWVEQVLDLHAKPFIRYVQIFENRGEVMGCSNKHPHGQIWCSRCVPTVPGWEDERQKAHFERHGRTLLSEVLERELQEGTRLVLQNESFAVIVPFWATWPFETLVLPKRPRPDITEMEDQERNDLADAMRRLGIRYDNLFKTSFPYSMGIHQQPMNGTRLPHWHWHIHYFPPLLRSATVKKFMVGYEMLAMPQRDITPEQAAERIRACPETHYRTGS